MGEQVITSLGTVNLSLKSRYNPSFFLNIKACILNHITNDIPPIQCDTNYTKILSKLNLADPEIFNVQSAPVHTIISVQEAMKLFSVSKPPSPLFKNIDINTISPYIIDTPMGTLVTGEIYDQLNVSDTDQCLTCVDCSTASSEIKTFFQNESISDDQLDCQVLNEDEIFAEKHFQETHSRDSNGRFIVKLPFKSNLSVLGNNRSKAFACFLNLGKKLLRNLPDYLCYQTTLQDFF